MRTEKKCKKEKKDGVRTPPSWNTPSNKWDQERAKNLSKTFLALHCFLEQIIKETQPST